MLAAAVFSVASSFLGGGGANSTLNPFHIQSYFKLVANQNYSILLTRILEKRFVHTFPRIFYANATSSHGICP